MRRAQNKTKKWRARIYSSTHLRHRGEEVVLDLEVEVRHPPVDEEVVRAVCRVIRRVERPGDVLRLRHDVLVSVADGKVDEDVGGAHADVPRIEAEGRAEAHVAKRLVPEHVAHGHPEELHVVVHAERVVRVLDKLPPVGDEGRDDAAKEEGRLQLEPRLVALLADDLVEGEEGQRL